MADFSQLRKQFFRDREQGEHARDVQAALSSTQHTESKAFEAFYAEPMFVASPLAGQAPESIECTRCVSVVNTETPVAFGSAVNFVWLPQRGGCQITSIDGLTPSNMTKYRFTLRFTYPKGGR
jgi:hypothetical protein